MHIKALQPSFLDSHHHLKVPYITINLKISQIFGILCFHEQPVIAHSCMRCICKNAPKTIVKCTVPGNIPVIPPNAPRPGLMLTHYTHKPLAPAQYYDQTLPCIATALTYHWIDGCKLWRYFFSIFSRKPPNLKWYVWNKSIHFFKGRLTSGKNGRCANKWKNVKKKTVHFLWRSEVILNLL